MLRNRWWTDELERGPQGFEIFAAMDHVTQFFDVLDYLTVCIFGPVIDVFSGGGGKLIISFLAIPRIKRDEGSNSPRLFSAGISRRFCTHHCRGLSDPSG
jgi:hypothetical protein